MWRVKNLNFLTFTEKHSSFIQRRLDYILILDTFEFLTMTEVLAPISTDHSLVLFSLSKDKSSIRGKGFWKLK